jgi:pimeloyl-ACP methyl ester carboxylesterase
VSTLNLFQNSDRLYNEPTLSNIRISGFDSQIAAQARVLISLIRSVQAGTYTPDIKASKIVLVGHSLGSFISNAAVALAPNLVDGKNRCNSHILLPATIGS